MAVGSLCPSCQQVSCQCNQIFTIPNYVQDTNCITIHNKNGDRIFRIDNDGSIYFGEDQVKIDNEKELALGFILVISELTGISFSSGNKDEFISKMIQHFRERQINKIL
jgi:hypothetical protein